MANFSLLRPPYSQPVRELHIALAHSFAVTKLTDVPRMNMLGRIYESLSWNDQLRCRAELSRCRQARRGQHLSVVS